MSQATLCWRCENACAKCSWSKDFTPVEGWVAIPTKIRESHEGTIDSYIVLKCPQFADDTDQYRPSPKIAPPSFRKFRNTCNKSPLRRQIEKLPVEELEKRIEKIDYNPEIARLALIDQKTYTEIAYIIGKSCDSVRKVIAAIVHKVAEAV